MAQVSFAPATLYFGAGHAMRMVGGVNDGAFADGLVKTGPAATAVKFCIAFKQGIAAGQSVISANFFEVFKLACPGAFGTFLAGNVVHISR